MIYTDLNIYTENLDGTVSSLSWSMHEGILVFTYRK